MCGLRLEHMIAVSEKVRALNPLFFNKINIKSLPHQEYLGIDFKQYVQVNDEDENINKNLIGALLLQEQQ